MKIRSCFISNSSSSSFCILEIIDHSVLSKILDSVGIPHEVDKYGCLVDEDYADENSLYGRVKELPNTNIQLFFCEEGYLQYAGIPVIPLLNQGLNLKEMQNQLSIEVKATIGRKVHPNDLQVICGEWYG